MVTRRGNKLDMITRALLELSRSKKRLLMLLADSLCIPLAFYSAFIAVSGWSSFTKIHVIDGLIALLSALPIFLRMGLYRAVIRYLSSWALWSILIGVTSSVLFMLFLDALVERWAHIPSATLVVYWAFAVIYVMGSRFLVRGLLLRQRLAPIESVIIYGAGAAGVSLVSSIIRDGHFHVVGFVDDDIALQKSMISGITVFPPKRISELINKYGVSIVLLAIPSASRHRRKQIIDSLEPLAVRVQVMPDMSEIISGNANVDDLRDVDAADLLGRDPVPPNQSLLSTCVENKVVMVTGAGGSIGSELCRQIVILKPRCLILFEVSEVSLYQVDRELNGLIQRNKLKVELVSLLGDVHNHYRMKEVMTTYGVHTVYHAAAYKHVPIVERNIIKGIRNNVFGTWHAAEAAIEAKVETFVLISTDKAVNPTNVMGATKRMSELVLQALYHRGSITRFCMVRFGNVLESSGSVVPLFREQIKRGGPVTVTHRDIIRYFMTIPEASQLVIQAGSMGKGGDVFVLDMGDPVRIYDLAVRMIHLMGCSLRNDQNPYGDIEIKFTGLRPAEKLYEELLIGSKVSGTEHQKILRATEHHLPWPVVTEFLRELTEAMNASNCELLLDIMKRAVKEYQPESGIEDLIWKHKSKVSVPSGNVSELAFRRTNNQ